MHVHHPMMMRTITLLYTLFCILSNNTPAEAFTLTNCNTAVSTTFARSSTSTCRAQISSSFNGRRFTKLHPPNRSRSRSNTKLSMFLQEGGGILGIGTPEIAVIALVGYFVLGPEDLYKVVKEIGKFITNVRQVATETTANFESSMESQLQIKELQKASQELNDAFSFRRSINYDEAAPTFGEDAAAVAAGAAVANSNEGNEENKADADDKPKKRKKVRRRKKVVEEEEQQPIMEIPDELEMPAEPTAMAVNTDPVSGDDWFDPNYQVTAAEEEEAASRAARMARLEAASGMPNGDLDTASGLSPQEEAAAQSRFAAQLSANWNDQIMTNQDALEPLGKVMERLAILEEERVAAEKRLEEEFRLRSELEEKFYLSKRELLEEAAAEIQVAAYENVDTNNKTVS